MNTMKILIQAGADLEIRNKSNKLYKDLCNNNVKREFTKTKIERLRKTPLQFTAGGRSPQDAIDDIKLGGVDINSMNNKQLREINKLTQQETDASKKQREKKEEIEKRISKQIVLTTFGKQIGCEVDEIGLFIEKQTNKESLWAKITKDQNIETITKQKELYKMMIYLTTLTLKTTN